MITELTDAQRAQFPEYVKRWTEIGLCTKPADRPHAEKAIHEIYSAGKLLPPKAIVWCGSPYSQALTRAFIRGNAPEGVWESVGASVRESVGESVRESVGRSVRASVWESVWESVRESVGRSVRVSVWESVGESGYGQHDADWLSYYSFFLDEFNLAACRKLEGYLKLAESAGWYLPYEKTCWISERHNTLKRDDRGRIHSVTGPAIGYPDGWSIYAVHGVRVPEWVIERQHEITSKKIDEEKNQEVRRVMLDLFGMEKYFVESNAKLISEDRFGKLYHRTYPDGDVVAFVKVINSTAEPDGTRKSYFLFTDRNCKTAHEAVAMSFNMTPEQYRPAQET